jgi:transcriptional regulator with XRE-family HTH domain
MRPSVEHCGSFAERLRQLRTDRGFRYARALASVLGMHENRYTRYERGEVEPNIRTILSICAALDTNPSHLLGYGDGPVIHCPTCVQIAKMVKSKPIDE